MKNKQALFPLTPASAYLSVWFFTCQKPRHHHIRGKALAGGTPGKSPAPSAGAIAPHLQRQRVRWGQVGRRLSQSTRTTGESSDLRACSRRRRSLAGSPWPSYGPCTSKNNFRIKQGEFSSPSTINISFTLTACLLRRPSAQVPNKPLRDVNFFSVHTARSTCASPYLTQCRADTKGNPLDRMDAWRNRDQGKTAE